MAEARPDLARGGTMQVTAKEGIEYLKSAGKDTLLEMQGLKDPDTKKPSVPRDSTMQSTAKAGKEFVERKGDTIENFGLWEADEDEEHDDDDDDKSDTASDKVTLPRDSTMEATAKEAHGLLAGSKLDPDAGTRGQQRKLEKLSEESAPPAKKPRLSKNTTMAATAKEAKGLLGDSKPDEDALTRGQQKKIKDIQAEKPAAKKAKLSKATTMAATAKEGAALLGGEKLADTRTETQRKKGRPTGRMSVGVGKRTSTIQKTMEEAKWVVDVDLTEGRKTRSASKPIPKAKPALKKAGTMQKTAKEGKEYLKRGKKSKKAAKVVVEEEVEEEVEESEED